MRVLACLALALAACTTAAPEAASSKPSGTISGSSAGDDDDSAPANSSSTTTTTGTTPLEAKDTLGTLQEVVYVIMQEHDESYWMCTGSLISEDIVVTAGHCLEKGRFINYQVIAPLANGRPSTAASDPTPMSDDFDDVAQPDFGFLRLEHSITLPTYAQLTDVTADVNGGKKVTTTTVVRTEELAEAPFHEVPNLVLKSEVDMGYDHGYGTPLFSHGGDSGAGLFLVENGQVTHKLVAMERQPDPDTNTDMLMRIDSDVLAWASANAK